MTPKKLFRSKTNRILFGVCGGLAEYFDIDPTIIRVICVLFIPDLVIYFLLALIIPEDPR
ncbi:PspC domain-containing protein [Eremococcus coleocola]|uniref:PspC domain protein n=1 Tax=Eremococcus coleocola ACS-139-V-Col8 TaxID=908337 RepID=E4KP34_9LACT|nr:PspC domain-containing protein [Eremococcus coleocola]EFR30937.1 PspC domain protein [Eremococcus coleocola ACS-139-V-Col8]